MIKSLKQYSCFARLWVLKYQQSIKETGSAVASNNIIYHSEEELLNDIEVQIKKLIISEDLENDISFEESMNILKGIN
jgi:hypothetical protein